MIGLDDADILSLQRIQNTETWHTVATSLTLTIGALQLQLNRETEPHAIYRLQGRIAAYRDLISTVARPLPDVDETDSDDAPLY